MLRINNLQTAINNKPILSGLDLEISEKSVHAIMGPNGSGKSTLAYTIMGHPAYEVTGGQLEFDGHNLLDLSPDERSRLGIFLSFQHPQALPGVKVSTMLRTAINEHRKQRGLSPLSVGDFIKELRTAMQQLSIPADFANRSVNDGFSGGERKRLEILQALILKPKLLILDEIDSGLDIDAIKIVAGGINELVKEGCSVLVITHYQRILNYLKPDQVHILAAGKIVKSGNFSLVEQLEKSSYEQIVNRA